MKNLYFLAQFFLISLLFVACNDDDKGSTTITSSDFSASIDENSASGTSLGKVSATVSDGTTATFAIVSQEPANAVSIDRSTGELTINDVTAFDYETNPTIKGTIDITAGSAMETINFTINVNDLDAFLSILSDSKAAYVSANNGDYIAITENEYNAIADQLNNTTKIGSSDTQYDGTQDPNTTGSFAYTMSNDLGATIPTGSYVVAVKFYSTNGSATGTKFKISETSISTGYNDLGNVLPNHGSGHLYYVLKGGSSKTSSEGYLSIYENGSVVGIMKDTSTAYCYESKGDIPNTAMLDRSSYAVMYQGISTTQKQW